MVKKLRFLVVNSFSEKTSGGNPAAVFSDTDGITDLEMQEIAKQLNLVETVFIAPSLEEDTDFHFRYFTPNEEVTLAGHPTIAAFVALLEEKKICCQSKNEFYINTLKGKQQIKANKTGETTIFTMKFPQPQFKPQVMEQKMLTEVLGISKDDLIVGLPIQGVDTGLGHLIVPVKSLMTLMEIKRNIQPLKELCIQLGVREIQAFTFETYNPDANIHTRNICPREGIEDPACGVGNSALGSYLLKHYYLENESIRIKAEQGHIVGMPSIIDVYACRKNNEIEVYAGGEGRVVVEGNYIVVK